MSTIPLVSVLMPVYNAESYLRAAIESILSQTFSDYEFIILNDGSTDSSHSIILEYLARDSRIVYKSFKENRGLPEVLNHGLRLARGKYIARMDADDISLPLRLEKQVAFMEANPEVGACGTWANLIGMRDGNIWMYPKTHAEIYARMIFACTIIHPSVMMRNEVLRKNNLSYDVCAVHVEDYDLWSRTLPVTDFANIPVALLNYRIHEENTARKHGKAQKSARTYVYQRLLNSLGVEPSMDELLLHERLGLYYYVGDFHFLRVSHSWLVKLLVANEKSGLIEKDAFEIELGEHWTEVCHASNVNIFFLVLTILASPLRFCGSYGISKLKPLIKFTLQRLQNEFTRANG
jgi:glycosyltransferase involved in cell wall biosynthesis